MYMVYFSYTFVIRLSHMSHALSPAQERFLAAYEAAAPRATITDAARRAGVHRATVYRWQADPTFKALMKAVWQRGYRRWFATVYEPEQRRRQQARAVRLASERPAAVARMTYARSCKKR